MNLAQLEEMLRELLQALQVVMQSGEELPDEVQGQLAQTLEVLVDRIQQLKTTEQIPQMPAAPHESSQINAFKYDPKTQELLVKYQDKYPSQNGPVYRYSGIPKYIYDVFARGGVPPTTSGRNAWHAWKEGVTPSLGAAANALIKAGGFPYQRVA